MMNPNIVPDFCLFGSFACFSFSAARRAWKACGQSLFAPFLGFAFGAWIDHILPTLPLVGGLFVNVRFGFSAARRAWKAVDNPYLRSFSVSRSGAGLTTLPTLSAVGGRSRFGAFHSATALRGFSINNFFFVSGRGNVDNPFRRFRPCLGPGLDCPHSHGPIRPRRSGRDPSSGLRRPGLA